MSSNSLIARYGNKHGDLSNYVGGNTSVIAHPEFENAIVKVIKGQCSLASEEKKSIKCFQNTNEIIEERDAFAEH